MFRFSDQAWKGMQMGEVVTLLTVAEAYIQPAPYRTDETVKSDLNRLMLLVDDTQIPIAGQGYVRYP